MPVEVLVLPTLEELRILLFQGDEEAVLLRLMDKCSSQVLTMIHDRVIAEKEGSEPPTALSKLIKSKDIVDSLTMAINLKKLAERRQALGEQVMPKRRNGGL